MSPAPVGDPRGWDSPKDGDLRDEAFVAAELAVKCAAGCRVWVCRLAFPLGHTCFGGQAMSLSESVFLMQKMCLIK